MYFQYVLVVYLQRAGDSSIAADNPWRQGKPGIGTNGRGMHCEIPLLE